MLDSADACSELNTWLLLAVIVTAGVLQMPLQVIEWPHMSRSAPELSVIPCPFVQLRLFKT
jgi:hypothetical protein